MCGLSGSTIFFHILSQTARLKKIKLAALSMLHKAKKAYYACDVICYPLSIAWLRVRVARYTHPVYSQSGSCHSDVTSLPPLLRYPLSIAWLRVRVARYTFLFSLAWPWRMKYLVKHNMLKSTCFDLCRSSLRFYNSLLKSVTYLPKPCVDVEISSSLRGILYTSLCEWMLVWLCVWM